MPLRPTEASLDDEPTVGEVARALRKLNRTSPGVSGIPADAWKVLSFGDGMVTLVREMVLVVWRDENLEPDWEVGLLAILPEKVICRIRAITGVP